MPFLDEAEPAPSLNPFRPIGAFGPAITPDERNTPVMGPERPPPSWSELWGASFDQENPIYGAWREMRAPREFGAPDPDHNPWDTIKDDPVLREHREAFLSSRNSAETEYIREKVMREVENRRIREASGLASSFLTDAVASILDPTTLLPGGGIYKGWRAGTAGLRSAASVGAMAAAGVTVQELMLQQQQLTRSWTESLLNVGGATLIGGLLGGGLSFSASRQLARASARVDADIARIAQERDFVNATERFGELEAKASETILTIQEAAELKALKAKLDEHPFGASAGAAVSRELQENIPASAFGAERAFAFQSPLTRALASGSRTVRDVATRLAETPFMLRQNREGIATGPAGGTVEGRIKVDGDVAIYRANKVLHEAFAEYRFARPDAKLARTRAAYADLTTPQAKRTQWDWKEFKAQVTAALRAETKEHGIEHPVPQVKAAAIAFRKEVFEPFKKEALRLGLLPKEADEAFGYVMRRWDVQAILRDYSRFHQILLDHLRGGQAAALRELARLEDELAAVVRSGDMGPEVASLRRQIDDVRQRFAVDEGTVDGIMEMWRFVAKDKPKKPLSLSEWVKKEGGLKDEGRTLEHMLGGRQSAGRLINNRGMPLDDAALRAFEKGYFDERPHINAFLDALDDDVRSGGNTHFARDDADALDAWNTAQEMRGELERYGIAGVTSEKKARRMIMRMMREENASEAVKRAREGVNEDRAFLDELTKIDATDPEIKAAVDDAKLDAEARIQDGENVTKRIDGDDGPVFASDPDATRRLINRMLDEGQAYRVPDDVVERGLAELEPYADLLPEGTSFAVWSSLAPSRRGPEYVAVTFRTADGREFGGDAVRADALNSRAMHLPGFNLVIARRIGEEPSGAGLGVSVQSGIYHEVVHAAWAGLDPLTRVRLIIHAESLGVLDMKYGDIIRAIGMDPDMSHPRAQATVRETYEPIYADRANKQDLIAQEAVAHMQELHFAGHFSDDQVAPVLADLMRLRGGAMGANALERELAMLDGPTLAVDASTGKSMRRDLDALGYYSQALEAAKTFQNKGTPEQALAWLKKNGVKDAEIEATGLRGFLEGKKSVTREEVVGHLEANRVGLTEVRSREPQILRDRNGNPVSTETLEQLDDAALAEIGITPEQANLHLSQLERGNHPKWQAYSLDPDNPTYRETVLHLPATRRMPFDEYLSAYRERFPQSDVPDTEVRTFYDRGVEVPGAGKITSESPDVFRSGHFPEPNIIGHMMTELLRNPADGKVVFVPTQIQSDWGQKLRDGGARDEAKIAALKAERQSLQPTLEAMRREISANEPDLASSVRRNDEGVINITLSPTYAQKHGAPSGEVIAAMERLRLVTAELQTAERSASGNPLVNTTDQWVNTTLRRAIRQAAEADAEYIAIPSGRTVLSYNPGD